MAAAKANPPKRSRESQLFGNSDDEDEQDPMQVEGRAAVAVATAVEAGTPEDEFASIVSKIGNNLSDDVKRQLQHS